MTVLAKKLGPLDAEGLVTERRSLRGAGNDSNVLGHLSIL
jgi:hypothetical protein